MMGTEALCGCFQALDRRDRWSKEEPLTEAAISAWWEEYLPGQEVKAVGASEVS